MSQSTTESELAELKELFATKLATDKVRQKAFDQLYQELRQYKEDFLFQSEKPLLLDLLLFYDSLSMFHESLTKQEMSPDVVADSYQYLVDEFLEVLYRRDVTPFEESNQFDRKLHKVVKVEPTEDASLDQKIQRVLKRGFLRSDKILRAEDVIIHRLKKK